MAYNVITETPTFNCDYSHSMIHSAKGSFIWITPYATKKEADAAAGYIQRCGNIRAVTKVEKV
jgi:hypothetical protein